MFKLFFDTAMLAADSQRVIALRMMKLAAGGKAAETEARRMVSEKMEAAADAATAMAFGASPGDIVKDYRRRVRANVKRLGG
ncbi:hypothetical protein sos41_12460 [Alphaproteobacteria bacterium SO-S41]|nr:hypothetical protein sos41_12460 [Alphaproteobacteria bacterium SO-S41]